MISFMISVVPPKIDWTQPSNLDTAAEQLAELALIRFVCSQGFQTTLHTSADSQPLSSGYFGRGPT